MKQVLYIIKKVYGMKCSYTYIYIYIYNINRSGKTVRNKLNEN